MALQKRPKLGKVIFSRRNGPECELFCTAEQSGGRGTLQSDQATELTGNGICVFCVERMRVLPAVSAGHNDSNQSLGWELSDNSYVAL